MFLGQVADPFWFQAIGCVLGYDWHLYGVTAVLTDVFKSTINHIDFGLTVCGEKGKTSRKTPSKIGQLGARARRKRNAYHIRND